MTPNKQERLLAALMTARSLKEAAEVAQMSYETAKRLMRTPETQAALAEMRQAATREAVLEAAALAERARETLREVMDDPRAPAYARVHAAEVALNYQRAISDLYDIAERLATLEARLDEQADTDRLADRPPAASPPHPRRPHHDGAGAEIEIKDNKDTPYE